LDKRDIGKVVKDFILKEFLPEEDPNNLNDSTPLISGGVLNSLATLQLVTFLEDTFDINVSAREVGIDYMDTIEDIVTFVLSKK